MLPKADARRPADCIEQVGGEHHVQHLLGARDVSYGEMTQVYGAAIAKPDLKYAQVPLEDFKNFMVTAWGASQDFADQMGEFTEALNAGRISNIAERDEESTTRS